MINLFFLDALPLTIRGAACKSDTGETFIVINSGLAIEQQAKTLRHEIAHIRLGHFDSEEPLAAIEKQASTF